MSIELPLESMTLADKLEAMEASWPDILRRPADLPSPDWLKDILYERRRHVAEGKLKFVDWDTTPMKPMSCTPATHRLLPILATSPGSPTAYTHSQSSDNSHQSSPLRRPSRHKISLSTPLSKPPGDSFSVMSPLCHSSSISLLCHNTRSIVARRLHY